MKKPLELQRTCRMRLQESGKPRGSWGAKEEQEAARVGNGPVVMSGEIHIKPPFEAGPQRGGFCQYDETEYAVWRRRIGVEPTTDRKACHRF